MQSQQVHLLRRLDRHEVHGRPLHGFCNRLGIAVVVLVPLEEWLHVLRRDQTNIVSKRGPAGGRCNELQSRLPCRSSSSECWQAGAQVERGSTSVAKRLPRADRGRRDGSYSCRGRYRSCRRRWMVRICVTWDVLLVLLNPPQDSTS